MSIKKTKVMHNWFAPLDPVTVGTTQLEDVREYIYFGRLINAQNELKPEIARRRRAAWTVLAPFAPPLTQPKTQLYPHGSLTPPFFPLSAMEHRYGPWIKVWRNNSELPTHPLNGVWSVSPSDSRKNDNYIERTLNECRVSRTHSFSSPNKNIGGPDM